MSKDTNHEIEVEADELIRTIGEFNTAEADRASDAGQTRQEIGVFLEKTGIHNKVFSQMRSLLKMKKESQKLDYLRSMDLVMPMVAEHIRKNATVDAFETPRQALDDAKRSNKPSYADDLSESPALVDEMDDTGPDPLAEDEEDATFEDGGDDFADLDAPEPADEDLPLADVEDDAA